MTCLLSPAIPATLSVQFHWLLTIFLLPWSPTQITVKLLQGIFCLIFCKSRHHLTNVSFSSFQKIIVLEEGMIITLYSLQIAQTMQRTTSWGGDWGFLGFFCFLVFVFFFKVVCSFVLYRQWYVLSVCDTDGACVVSAFLQGLA